MFILQILLLIAIIGALVSLALTILPLWPTPVVEVDAEVQGESGEETAPGFRCPECGVAQPRGNRFCGKCGSPLGEKT